MIDPQQETQYIKRFGYVISAVLLIISNISLIENWTATPYIFLITMYFLTGALWGPALIKPFYRLFARYFLKNSDKDDTKASEDLFSKN